MPEQEEAGSGGVSCKTVFRKEEAAKWPVLNELGLTARGKVRQKAVRDRVTGSDDEQRNFIARFQSTVSTTMSKELEMTRGRKLAAVAAKGRKQPYRAGEEV